MILHADPCTLCMHGSLQSDSPEKGFRNTMGKYKTAAGCAAAVWWINEPGGMQNRNGTTSGVLLLVPVVVPVLFPAVAVR